MMEWLYKDHQLSIDTPPERLRFRWGLDPAAERWTGRRWVLSWPAIRLLEPPRAEQPPGEGPLARKHLAFQAFRESLPENLVPMVERFPSHQWVMLHLLHQSQRACDLAESNPVLCWCTALNFEFRDCADPDTFYKVGPWHCGHKQRRIAAWLGFPDVAASVKTLKKIPPEAVHPSLLRVLARTLHDQSAAAQHLNHYSRLHAGLLYLVVVKRLFRQVSPALLHAVARDDAQIRRAETADRLSDIQDQLRQMAPNREMPVFNHPDEINEAHVALGLEYEAWRMSNRERAEQRQVAYRELSEMKNRGVFPPPPIPGTEAIIPITTSKELMEEGWKQHHCVATTAQKIWRGGFYVYRMLRPERATIAVSNKDSDGGWFLREAKLKWNQPVSKTTEKAVRDWLALHAAGL